MMAAPDFQKERQQRVDSLLQKGNSKLKELMNLEKKVQSLKKDLEDCMQKLHCMTCTNYPEKEDLTSFEELCQDLEKLINDELFRGTSLDLNALDAKPLRKDDGKDMLKREKNNQGKEREGEKKELERNNNVDETQQQSKHFTAKRSMPGTSKITPLKKKPRALCGVSTSATASATQMPMKSLSLVKTFDLPAWMEGMDSVNKDTAVVCFGGPRSSTYGKKQSATYFSISEERRKPLKLKATITKASDIIHLKDGRLVAAHEKGTMKVYNVDGSEMSGSRYPSMKGFNCHLCSDQKNNIYVVNGTPKILKYHPDGEEVQREIKTGKVKPEQICVTADGAYLVTTTFIPNPISVTVFDKDGNRKGAITGDPYGGPLCAAIDAKGRVLVASVHVQYDGLGKLSLYRYCLQEGHFSAKEHFMDVTLSPTHSRTLPWCYMVSLSPTMLAFAYEWNLHFIHVQE